MVYTLRQSELSLINTIVACARSKSPLALLALWNFLIYRALEFLKESYEKNEMPATFESFLDQL